jgi:thiamine biosynthesis protein ThiI
MLRLSSELATKARQTRKRFMRKLVENVREAMRSTGADFTVESIWTRILVHTNADPAALRVLSRVAGLSSYSVVLERCPAELDEIVRTGVKLFGEAVKGRSYAVRARRSGTHPFSSSDVMYALGAALNPGARVDLTHPDIEVEVEVRDGEAYFISPREPGLGGLPLGLEGRAICLISGGFDSAAAAWMLLKRGVQLDYVFCNLAGGAYERSVVGVAKTLADDWSHGTRPKLHVVNFNDVVDDLRAHSPPRLWQLVLKRLMYAAAEQVAKETGALAIITGEALGQVSSQTLANLAAIDGATTLPVFRPLIGFDKTDIVDLTRKIGTFDLSSKVKEYCAIAPGNPATAASVAETESACAGLNPAILAGALENRRQLDLRTLRGADLILDYLFVDEVPSGAVVLDLRPEEEWLDWRYPGSIRRDSWEVSANPASLDRDTTYVLHCGQGLQSAQVAEVLQRAGLEAYAYRGGTPALRGKATSETVVSGTVNGAGTVTDA